MVRLVGFVGAYVRDDVHALLFDSAGGGKKIIAIFQIERRPGENTEVSVLNF